MPHFTQENYLVSLRMPHDLPCSKEETLTAHQLYIDLLIDHGVISSYSYSVRTAQIWIFFNKIAKSKLMDIILELPMTQHMEILIDTVWSNVKKKEAPVFSLN